MEFYKDGGGILIRGNGGKSFLKEFPLNRNLKALVDSEKSMIIV
jgi:hypothetical protein